MPGPDAPGEAARRARPLRVRVFVDYRDFRRGADAALGGSYEPDWERLTRWLASEAFRQVTGAPASVCRIEGATVYVAVTRAAADGGLRAWATTDLERVPGVSAVLVQIEGPRASLCDGCGACDATSGRCGSGASLAGGEAVATAIRADLLRLSREDAFDWAVLLASDRRLAPVAGFLATRGRGVVHAGFAPRGRELAAACRASLDLRSYLERFASA